MEEDPPSIDGVQSDSRASFQVQPRRAFSEADTHILEFILLLGVVSALSDITCETGRSVSGPYLALLGAGAATIGWVSGLGEFLGYGPRLAPGYLAARTRAYWAATFLGLWRFQHDLWGSMARRGSGNRTIVRPAPPLAAGVRGRDQSRRAARLSALRAGVREADLILVVVDGALDSWAALC